MTGAPFEKYFDKIEESGKDGFNECCAKDLWDNGKYTLKKVCHCPVNHFGHCIEYQILVSL